MAPESCHLIRSACLPLRMSSVPLRWTRVAARRRLRVSSRPAPAASSSPQAVERFGDPPAQVHKTDVEQLRRVSDFLDESLLIPPHGARCHLPSPLLDNFYHRCRCFVQVVVQIRLL
ncbi:hypothetical protein PVAP13_4KG306415 [Panicum virgatum]|uniref:Uncharacterized protein n=1 Tax=Panicum virgatum TaxID=38727 RepID=A0A8T0TVN2_PANVG|nr:hypothetical protein PVAP13_4KG306415 [Panicum virgatum]